MTAENPELTRIADELAETQRALARLAETVGNAHFATRQDLDRIERAIERATEQVIVDGEHLAVVLERLDTTREGVGGGRARRAPALGPDAAAGRAADRDRPDEAAGEHLAQSPPSDRWIPAARCGAGGDRRGGHRRLALRAKRPPGSRRAVPNPLVLVVQDGSRRTRSTAR
jgi:hypothetical protein